MKQIYKYALAIVCMIITTAAFTSCEWDTSPEPEHPMYVTYTLSAGCVSFSGPDQLLDDIEDWIKVNSISYDTPVNYSSGDASEFTTTDAEAVKKYNNEFLPKFNSFLNELNSKLNSGTYGKGISVKATFYTFAKRVQGQQSDLKYDQFEYSYPTNSNTN